MQAQTIITDVRKELLEISPQFWSDAELLRYFNRGELDYTQKVRPLEGIAYVTLIQGQVDYPLPSNWISEKLVFIKIQNTDGTYKWKRLYPTNIEKNAQQNPNFLNTTTDNQGTPLRFWIFQKSIWLNRAPDAANATQLALLFKAKPIPLTATTQEINIDDSLSEAMFEYVMYRALKKAQEYDLASEHKLEYDKYILEGRKAIKKQSADQRNRIDIDSGIPIDGNSDPLNALS